MAAEGDNAPPLRILVINPNTSTNMTRALEPVVTSLPFPHLQFTFHTCPNVSNSIPSINSPADAVQSADICLPSVLPLIETHDAFLVACYSHHPLVKQIRAHFPSTLSSPSQRPKYVTGIFESSVLMSLNIISDDSTFGIVSTGKVWEAGLTDAVNLFLGGGTASNRFAGCETTGLNATELHDLPAEEVRVKMTEATRRLVKAGQGRLAAICLGCAGMVGLDDAVRAGCVAELGEEKGREIRIVDGVKAGVVGLVAAARGGF